MVDTLSKVDPTNNIDQVVVDHSRWRILGRSLLSSPGALIGASLILLLVLMAIFAPLIAPYDPIQARLTARFAPPSIAHLVGTDIQGRDVFSRLVWGARISLSMGFLAIAIAAVLGTIIGLWTGFYYGGWMDVVGSKAIELLLAFPGIMIAIVIVTVFGASTTNVMLAVGMMLIPRFAWVVRGAAAAVSQSSFIEASRAVGAGDIRIILLHVLPNVTAPILVLATLSLGEAIIASASLSFLGLGVQPPYPEWGSMLSGARDYLRQGWWTMAAPGVLIVISVLSINLVGDWLRDALDPRN